MNTAWPTAVVVDDAILIRQALPVLMPKLHITSSFATADEFCGSGVRADLVILEMQRVDKCPDEVRRDIDDLRRVVSQGHQVCSYTQETRPFVHAACLASGARGVISKADPLPVAQELFLSVAGGDTIITADLVAAFDLLPRRRQLAVLTECQRSILTARARRWSFPVTAAHLGLPEDVVRTEWQAASEALARYLHHADLDTVTARLDLDPGALADIWPTAHQRSSSSTQPRSQST